MGILCQYGCPARRAVLASISVLSESVPLPMTNGGRRTTDATTRSSTTNARMLRPDTSSSTTTRCLGRAAVTARLQAWRNCATPALAELRGCVHVGCYGGLRCCWLDHTRALPVFKILQRFIEVVSCE